MQASSRIVYGRAFRVTPAWLWILQRVSGLLLGPLVLLHMSTRDLANSPVLNGLVLIIVLGHGYSGISRLRQEERHRALVALLVFVWLALVAVFGTLIVLYGQPL